MARTVQRQPQPVAVEAYDDIGQDPHRRTVARWYGFRAKVNQMAQAAGVAALETP